MKNYYSHGKLLLTGEYVVLDGALALAVPTRFGQSLKVEEIDVPKLIWKSLNEDHSPWFETTFEIHHGEIMTLAKNQGPISNRLFDILQAVKSLNPDFLKSAKGYRVTTHLEFPNQWGLGSSSTLINNIAQWANIDPYKLLAKTFGGSGYDIACAANHSAITYQLEPERCINQVSFKPSFKAHLYFVYLNKKQNSRAGIAQYETFKKGLSKAISKIDSITKKMIDCQTLDAFCKLMEAHEELISEITKQKPIQTLLFNDFEGSIKSLGAWGGDFILVASKTNPEQYFKNKGFYTILGFDAMVIPQ